MFHNFTIFHAKNIKNSLAAILFIIHRMDVQPYDIALNRAANNTCSR